MDRFAVLTIAGAMLLCVSLPVLVGDEGGETAAPAEEKGEGLASKFMPQVKSYPAQAGKKLMRGATNLGRSVTEFYFQPVEAREESGMAVAMLWPGMGEGVGMFLTRIVGGALEVGTFAVPFPNGWQPLLEE